MQQPRNNSGASVNHAGRRVLSFSTLIEIMPDVCSLEKGHRTIGVWSLAQICRHLADAFDGSIDGFDLRNHRIKRFFLKKQMLRVALTKGIPTNYSVDPKLTPRPGGSTEAATASLAAAIDRFVSHDGPLQAHPLFGNMPRDTWDRVHRVHCAHHLSFALPAVR